MRTCLLPPSCTDGVPIYADTEDAAPPVFVPPIGRSLSSYLREAWRAAGADVSEAEATEFAKLTFKLWRAAVYPQYHPE